MAVATAVPFRAWVVSVHKLAAILAICCLAANAIADTFEFERLWPTLPNAWYFDQPDDIAISPDGAVWVSNHGLGRWEAYSEDGKFLRSVPYGPNVTNIAFDESGNAYIGNGASGGLSKLDAAGNVVWALPNGTFGQILDIAPDFGGNLYVLVSEITGRRVYKYSQEAGYLNDWAISGNRIVCDKDNNFYVIEAVDFFIPSAQDNRISKYDPDGTLLLQWGASGTLLGQFNFPNDLTLLDDGRIAVLDQANARIQLFNAQGQAPSEISLANVDQPQYLNRLAYSPSSQTFFIADRNEWKAGVTRLSFAGDYLGVWGSQDTTPGYFRWCGVVASSTDDRVFALDIKNRRVQIFDSNGSFLEQIGSTGNTDFAVSDNSRLFTIDNFVDQIKIFSCPSNSTATLDFAWPVTLPGVVGPLCTRIDVDTSGLVYIAESTSQTVFVMSVDDQNQQLVYQREVSASTADFTDIESFIADIEIRRSDNALLIAGDRGLVGIFDTSGTRVGSIDLLPTSNNQWVRQIESSSDGRLFVTGHRDGNDANGGPEVTVYAVNGTILDELGDRGSAPGTFNVAYGIAIDSQGDLYVADQRNSRIQKFNLVPFVPNARAIVVAAGGAFQGNDLWDATQVSANFAYRTLASQGFRKETIYYLSSDLDLDLDSNGALDDVDADATNANLEQALTQWATGAEDVVVYLVDHGGDGTFRMSVTETLTESDLAAWLNTLEGTISGTLTVVYDACQSGSFVDSLTAPGRIVIASAQATQNAYFLSQGTISYSNFFWTHVFNGESIGSAHTLAAQSISDVIGNRQTPQLNDPSAIAATTSIGNGTDIVGSAPVIGSVTPEQQIVGTSTATVTAFNVTDSDGIARVWATLRQPGYALAAPDNPVVGLPTFELFPTGNANEFAGTYTGFTTPGTYLLAVYAADRIGNTSLPMLTSVVVDSPLRRKAIVVAAGNPADARWPSVAYAADLAYDTLLFQGYDAGDIEYLTAAIQAAPGELTLSTLETAITDLASQSVRDLTLYMVGAQAASGTLNLNNSEDLTATALDGWLDTLQNSLPADGAIAVVYDAPSSGSFVPALIPPVSTQRMVVTSTGDGQPAAFLQGGSLSFSGFFWKRIFNGANLFEAYSHARLAMRFANSSQFAQLDDNSNGTANEKSDGVLARRFRVGAGVLLAGDDPLIGQVVGPEVLTGQTWSTLWVDQVTSTSPLSRVYAAITRPGFDGGGDYGSVANPAIVELENVSGDRWEGVYADFTHNGVYEIAIYAEDIDGGVSLPGATTVEQTGGIDGDYFEIDDAPAEASWIGVNGPAQRHTHHDAGDQDWARFYATDAQIITIYTENLNTGADTYLEVFAESNTTTPLDADDNSGLEGNGSSALIFLPPSAGYYYLRVTHATNGFGTDTGYDLRVIEEIGFFPGTLTGVVKSSTGEFIGNADLKITQLNYPTRSDSSTGVYIFESVFSGTYSVEAKKSGFTTSTLQVTIGAGELKQLNFTLTPNVPSGSSNIYVDFSAPPGGTGSLAKPFRLTTEAMQAVQATPVGNIYILPGTSAQTLSTLTYNKPMRLERYGTTGVVRIGASGTKVLAGYIAAPATADPAVYSTSEAASGEIVRTEAVSDPTDAALGAPGSTITDETPAVDSTSSGGTAASDFLIDSDGDGISDGLERNHGSDPNSGSDVAELPLDQIGLLTALTLLILVAALRRIRRTS